ncbi:MAG: 3'-5' exoribonuclease [Candidatus Saccharimonadales bacterium]
MRTIEYSPLWLERTGQQLVQCAPQAFIDVDVEADGIAGYGSLLSIGAVSPWGDEFYAELRPSNKEFIPGNRAFCEWHNLGRERLLDEGQDPRATLANFSEWTHQVLSDSRKLTAVLTAYNASYDFPLIDAYYKKLELENPYGHAAFCIKSLAMAIQGHGQWDWKQTGKGSLPTALIPEGDFTHNALEDARYQQRIHFRLAGLIDSD